MGVTQETQGGELKRPDVFSYSDIRVCLRDWFSYLKAMNPGLSLHAISQQAGFKSRGYVTNILNGTRNLTASALQRLGTQLQMEGSELSYLELLRSISETQSNSEREKAFRRIQAFAKFHQIDQSTLAGFRYLSKWYHVAIRELALLDQFKLDPIWIQKKLRHPVPLQDIIKAVEFLLEQGLIEKRENGSVRATDQILRCTDGIHRLALTDYQTQILGLAKESIRVTPRTQRELRGMMMPLTSTQYRKVQKKTQEFLRQLREIAKEEDSGEAQIYMINHLLFPLTKESQNEE